MTNSISCLVCQNICSIQASTCPKCGHPFIDSTVAKATKQNGNEFSCPKCGSDQTSTLKMAYAQGTSSGRVSAGTITADGNLALTGGRVNSQSGLARQIAPPRMPSTQPGVFVALLVGSAIVSFIIVSFIQSGIVFLLVFGFLLVGGIYYYNQQVQKQMPEYKDKIAKWKNAVICFRCGGMWTNERRH